MVSVLNTISN